MVSAMGRVKQGKGIARRKGLINLNSEVREGLPEKWHLDKDLKPARMLAMWKLEEEDVRIRFLPAQISYPVTHGAKGELPGILLCWKCRVYCNGTKARIDATGEWKVLEIAQCWAWAAAAPYKGGVCCTSHGPHSGLVTWLLDLCRYLGSWLWFIISIILKKAEGVESK